MCCRHNDLAYELRDNFKNQLGQIDLLQNTSGQYGTAWQTDIPRLRAGHVGGQVGLLTELANQSASTLTSYARFLSAQPPLPCPYLLPLLQTGMPYGIRDGSLGWLNQNYYRGTHHPLAPFFLVWRCPPPHLGVNWCPLHHPLSFGGARRG